MEHIGSWAVPTEADVSDWEALSRDEQVAHMRALFNSPECNTLSPRSFAEIIAEARRKARSGQNG